MKPPPACSCGPGWPSPAGNRSVAGAPRVAGQVPLLLAWSPFLKCHSNDRVMALPEGSSGRGRARASPPPLLRAGRGPHPTASLPPPRVPPPGPRPPAFAIGRSVRSALASATSFSETSETTEDSTSSSVRPRAVGAAARGSCSPPKLLISGHLGGQPVPGRRRAPRPGSAAGSVPTRRSLAWRRRSGHRSHS